MSTHHRVFRQPNNIARDGFSAPEKARQKETDEGAAMAELFFASPV